MKKKEYERAAKKSVKVAEDRAKRKRQDEFDATIKDSDRNPNAKEDMDKVLQAMFPPVKYIKRADRK